jgi:hypothetical protein
VSEQTILWLRRAAFVIGFLSAVAVIIGLANYATDAGMRYGMTSEDKVVLGSEGIMALGFLLSGHNALLKGQKGWLEGLGALIIVGGYIRLMSATSPAWGHHLLLISALLFFVCFSFERRNKSLLKSNTASSTE